MRRTALLLALAAAGLAAPAAAQRVDLDADPADPRTATEARAWLDSALADVDRGRTVMVPTPDGPLPFLLADRSALSEAQDLAAATGAPERDALRWSATVLREQRALRERLDRTRTLALAGGAPAAEPARTGPAPPPRVAVIRRTPDAAPPAPEPAGSPTADASAGDPSEADPDATPAADLAGTIGGDGVEPAGSTGPPPGTSTSPAAGPAIVGGAGGGPRGGRRPGTAAWAAIALGMLALALGGALVVARRRPAPAPAAPAPGPPPGPRIDLALDLSGPAGGRSARFRAAPVLVGRDPASDLVIDDPRVSRRHARIVVEDGALWIEDLGSRAGVEIDGRAVRRAELRRGTAVRLGDTTVTVR